MKEKNFLTDLEQEVRSKFPVLSKFENLKCDGTINRLDSTKKNDGAVWIAIHAWEFKGKNYQKANYGNWKTGSEFVFRSYKKKQENDFRKIEKSIPTKNLNDEKQKKHKECREKWFSRYNKMPKNAKVHSYLRAKQIDSNFLARVNLEGCLFVPIFNDLYFVGGQNIFRKQNEFVKRFTYGIEISGSFCPFGKIREAEIIYIAEGFATAASVFMAFKDQENVAVATAFNASNIFSCAKTIRKVNPNCYIVFAADNDKNEIGETKAKFASQKITNSTVKVVEFKNKDKGFTDYNDLHCAEGIEEVKEQLDIEKKDFAEIIPVGFDQEDNYYYYSTEKNQIVRLFQHTRQALLLQAPANYWGEKYGFKKDKEGNITTIPAWDNVLSCLGTMIRAKGLYNPEKTRRGGLWIEGEKTIINDGEKLWIDNKVYPFFNNGLNLKNIYQSDQKMEIPFDDPLTQEEMDEIENAFSLLCCKQKNHYKIILGWIYCANLFNATKWRPHIWITGGAGTGKSTVLKYIYNLIPFCFYTGDSTASGLRQRLATKSCAVVFDEAENSGVRGKRKMEEVLSFARQISTQGNYSIFRGTPGQNAIEYNASSIFCLGSIQIPHMEPADLSRFLVIDLLNNESGYEQFSILDSRMKNIAKHSKRLFVKGLLNLKTFLKNIEIAIRVLTEKKKIEIRLADQIAPLIAGYFGILCNDTISDKFILCFFEDINFSKGEYFMENQRTEAESCFNDIFNLQIPGRQDTVGQTVVEAVDATVQGNPRIVKECQRALETIGLRIGKEGEHRFLFVSNQNKNLKSLMERTESYSDYNRLLMRHPLYLRSRTMRINDIVTRGKIIKIN